MRIVRHSGMIGLAFVFLMAGSILFSQPVIQYKGSDAPLRERWSWATNDAAHRKFGQGFWIAYTIQRLMDENSFIATGMFFTGSTDQQSSLYNVVLDERVDSSLSELNRRSNIRGLSMIHRGKKTPFKVIKDVAILVRYDRDSNVEDVRICNMELNFDLKRKPISWVGSSNDDQSEELLEGIYARVQSDELKENVVDAVGIHQQSSNGFDFLVKILKGKHPKKARSQAAFWIGHHAKPEALEILFAVAQSEDAKEVREQAVFAISQIDSEDALEKLITLATRGKDTEIRRKATFWLGQKASTKAINTLEELLADDEDTEVQKRALHALARSPGGAGVEKLISVARKHPKVSIRKQAIFSLGQSDDPKAREALIEIARGK